MDWIKNTFTSTKTPRDSSKYDDMTIPNTKKFNELKRWMENQTCKKTSPAYLFLSGPSGSGKKTAVTYFAGINNIYLPEWTCVVAEHYHLREGEKTIKYSKKSEEVEFRKFIFKSDRYCSVLQCQQPPSRIILVHELPFMYLSNPDAFVNFLRDFKSNGRCPIIFITDDLHTLLPHQKYKSSELSIETIEFNPMSRTLIRSILRKAHIDNKHIEHISKACQGDANSAVNVIQSSTLGHSSTGISSRINTRPSFFHILGKILYAKRDTRGYLAEEPDNLINLADISDDKLILFLHQNYLDFCGQEALVSTLDFISLSDILSTPFGNYTNDQQKSDMNGFSSSILVHAIMTSVHVPTRAFKPISRPLYYSFITEKSLYTDQLGNTNVYDSNNIATYVHFLVLLGKLPSSACFTSN